MSLIFALESGSILHPRTYSPRMVWIAILLGFVLTSCNSKKYLTDDQSFLFENKIRIKSDHKVDDAPDLKEKLTTLVAQRKTRTPFFIPRHVFYYQYQERLKRHQANPDKRKGFKEWSEEKLQKNKPVIYDSIKANETVEKFEKYLALRGYRNARASYNSKTSDKLTTVYYTANPGARLYIDTMLFMANDSSIQHIIESNLKNTHIPPGSPLDLELFNREKVRLAGIMQNEGYALFDESFIPPLEVDTSGGRVKAIMRILNESDSSLHKKYYVGTVTIIPDYLSTDTSYVYDTVVADVRYLLRQPKFTLKPEAIDRNLFMHKGDLARRDNFTQTLKSLSRMEVIHFVRPTTNVDTSAIDTPRINYSFYLSRNKKISTLYGAELTYASLSLQGRSLLGTAANFNYRDLNLLKGAEILSIAGEGGIEFNFQKSSSDNNIGLINSVNVGAGLDLLYPRFMDPLGIYNIIGNKQYDDQPALITSKLRRWLLFDANTRFNVSYNYVDFRELYVTRQFNMGLSYTIQPDNYHSLVINRLGFELFVPSVTQTFRERVLSQSRFLAESFDKYLFTGLLFRGYASQYDAPTTNQVGFTKVDHSVEISGLEIWLANTVYNAITDKEIEFALGKENPDTPESELINFSQFAKAELDFRYFYNFNSNLQLVFRFNPGIAAPFRKSQTVPYLKQFYVGGVFSNRGWQIRELGPGGYRDTVAEDIDFSFYQTGDIKLDMSVEMRFPLVSYFDGAVFVDAGNVWLLYKDENRLNANFDIRRFYKELGISYGFGLRLDLDFFILRLDLGYKLYSPFKLDDGTHLYKGIFPTKPEIQFGVGLPFN